MSQHTDATPPAAMDRFEEAFRAIWTGEAESDGFNALVLRDYDPEGTRLRLPGLAHPAGEAEAEAAPRQPER